MILMLEGLDEINWSELGHAYGWVTNVPKMIRDLVSENDLILETQPRWF